jgi:hypothetical protein
MTITTMRAVAGTRVSGVVLAVPATRAQKLRVAPFAPWTDDNSRGMSARRYRHT